MSSLPAAISYPVNESILHALAEATSTILVQDCGFYLPPVLPMPDGSESYLLRDVDRSAESATYRHKITGEMVTFGWLDCTTV